MTFTSDETTYKHSIIQFSQVLLEKYILSPTSNQLTEKVIYGYLFGKLLSINEQQLDKLLRLEKRSNDAFLESIRDELLRMEKNKGSQISKLFVSEIEKYANGKYSGSIDNSRAKSLIGDILLLSLMEASYGLIENNDRILTKNLLGSLKENKTQEFLKVFLDIMRISGDVDSDSVSRYPELIEYRKALSAFIQYFEFLKFVVHLDQSRVDPPASERLEYLDRRLKFMKIISTDMYDLIKEENFKFGPSDEVISRYLYIATFLIKVEYDESVSLNRFDTADFYRIKLGSNEPLDKLIRDGINNTINPPEISRYRIVWFLNPLKFLESYIGVLASWILWSIVLLLLIDSAPFYLTILTGYTLDISFLGISFGPEFVPLALGIWLFISLTGLFFHLVRIKRKWKI